MGDYWRPSIAPEKRKDYEDFIDNHPELPVNTPKELMLFAANKLITEVETGAENIEQQQEALEELKNLLKEGEL